MMSQSKDKKYYLDEHAASIMINHVSDDDDFFATHIAHTISKKKTREDKERLRNLSQLIIVSLSF